MYLPSTSLTYLHNALLVHLHEIRALQRKRLSSRATPRKQVSTLTAEIDRLKAEAIASDGMNREAGGQIPAVRV